MWNMPALFTRAVRIACCVALLTTLTGIAEARRPARPPRPPMVDRPLSEAPDKFTFAVLGDKTSGGDGQWEIFDTAVREINLLNPDLVIMVGDMIPGHMEEREEWDRQWAEFMGHANGLQVPLYFHPGNHDISNLAMQEWWHEDFGPTYYSFDHKGCHFLLINSEEERVDGRGPVWQAQMRWIQQDLAQHADARYTFVFMHKPMWNDPRYEQDWPVIETALGNRPYAVFAGHIHDLTYERRNGRRHIVHAATGGGIGLSEVKELGSFHHYTMVSVDTDSVRMAVCEPGGPIWPEDIAPRSFRQGVEEMVQFSSLGPMQVSGDEATVRTTARFHNTLPDTAYVRVRLAPENRWRVRQAYDTTFVMLPPGGELERPYTFSVDVDSLTRPPRTDFEVTYHGHRLRGGQDLMVKFDIVPIYPAASFRVIPDWMVVGPFDLGEVNTRLLRQDPRQAIPGAFVARGPEQGYQPNATFTEGDRTLCWEPARCQSNGMLNYNALIGTQDHAAGYSSCAVYSPVEQTVYGVIQGDNFVQTYLDGELIEDGQTFGGPGSMSYAPLRLHRGWNRLVVKLLNNRADWFLRFFIGDPQGNLRFAAHPE